MLARWSGNAHRPEPSCHRVRHASGYDQRSLHGGWVWFCSSWRQWSLCHGAVDSGRYPRVLAGATAGHLEWRLYLYSNRDSATADLGPNQGIGDVGKGT